MARSIPEWEKAISELTPEDRVRYLKALETLETWPLFNKEFGWTNIFIIGALIKIRCDRFNELDGLETPPKAAMLSALIRELGEQATSEVLEFELSKSTKEQLGESWFNMDREVDNGR